MLESNPVFILLFANKYYCFSSGNKTCRSGCSAVDTRWLFSNTQQYIDDRVGCWDCINIRALSCNPSNFLMLYQGISSMFARSTTHSLQGIHPPFQKSALFCSFTFKVSQAHVKCISRVLKVTVKTHWIESGTMMTVEWGIVRFEGADLWLVDSAKMTLMWQGIGTNWLVIGRGPGHPPGYSWKRFISCQT